MYVFYPILTVDVHSHPRLEVYHLVNKKQKKGVACVSTVSTGGDLSCDMPNQVVWKLRTRRSFYSIHDLSPSDASHPFFSGTPVLRLEIVCGLWKRTGRNKK